MNDAQKVIDNFHSHIANVLSINQVPLDNVFFINTPNSIVFYSSYDKSIMQRPAADYSNFFTRKVIFEKCKQSKKYTCFHNRKKEISEDNIETKALSVMNYKLNWNESCYGKEFDMMKSLRKFIESKSHLPIFLYVDSENDFFETLQKTKKIRVATLDTTVI